MEIKKKGKAIICIAMIVAIAGLWPALGSSPYIPVSINYPKDNTGRERTGRKPPAAL